MSVTLLPVSWERMSNGLDKLRERLRRAVAALEGADIPYAVIGGQAVAAWVSRVDETAVRNTRDVDLLLDRASLPAMKSALAAAGFIHRRIAALGRAGEMDVFLDGPEGRVRDALHIVFANEKVRPDDGAPSADVRESEFTGEFQLISLEALVRMKLTAFRDKDRVHLRDLVDVGLVDADWVASVPADLRPRLQSILDNPGG